jgi:hypothetical protein
VTKTDEVPRKFRRLNVFKETKSGCKVDASLSGLIGGGRLPLISQSLHTVYTVYTVSYRYSNSKSAII